MKKFGAQKAYLVCMVIMSLFVSILAGCGGGGGGHWNEPVTSSSVTVSTTAPANGETTVFINRKISATFSGAMDPATITQATFTLKHGTTAVPGTVTYSGVTAVFTPIDPATNAQKNLDINTTYTATITTGAKDLTGKPLASDYVWSFTTGEFADDTLPRVSATINSNGATGVPINTKVGALFSEPMDPTTINAATFTFTQGATPVPGTVSYSGVNAVFTPASNLLPNTTYTATITTGATDLAGNALAGNQAPLPAASSYVWSWTTGSVPDITAPTVASTDPANLATGVALSKRVSATFSEPMDPLTITNANFTLTGPGVTPVAGTVTNVGLVSTFTPTSPLALNTTYTARITTVATDLTGNALASAKVWSFTTVPALAAGPLPVDLGMAGNYVILAKSAISTTGTTEVTGNLGLSPNAASFITGFALAAPPTTFSTSSLVTGQVFAADYDPPTPINLTTAVLNMETAYTDAAGRAADVTELGAGDIGGMNLAPGTYKWSSGVVIPTSVTLTGGPNDVWIFQIAQNLVMSSATSINLSGGAQAKNIFWQVFGIVDIGTTAHFEGIALVKTAITLRTGASVNGRLLAQTAVSLDSNPVTQPAP